MADSYTPYLNLRKPEVGAAKDNWGSIPGLNGDMDLLDAVFAPAGDGTSVGIHIGTGKTIDARGGTAAFTDTRFILSDVTGTKGLMFDLSAIVSGTTLTIRIEEVVTVDGVQTLTNKTLTAPAIDAIVTSGGTLTIPIATGVGDAMVTCNAVQTLLGKTLTAPVMTTPDIGVAHGVSVSADTFMSTANNVVAKTGSYALTNAENGKTITMDSASACTLSVPAGLTPGFSCTIVQLGAGQVTIGGSSSLRGRNGLKLAGQNAVAGLIYILADTYVVGGDVVA